MIWPVSTFAIPESPSHENAPQMSIRLREVNGIVILMHLKDGAVMREFSVGKKNETAGSGDSNSSCQMKTRNLEISRKTGFPTAAHRKK